MDFQISLGMGSIDLETHCTEAYPDGEIFLNLDVYLPELLRGKEGYFNRVFTKKEIEDWEEFLCEMMQHEQIKKIVDDRAEE